MLPYVADLINLRWRTIIKGKSKKQKWRLINSGVRRERCALLLTLLLEMEPRKGWSLEAGKQGRLSHPHSLAATLSLTSRLPPSIPNNDSTNPCCLNHGFGPFLQKWGDAYSFPMLSSQRSDQSPWYRFTLGWVCFMLRAGMEFHTHPSSIILHHTCPVIFIL